MAHNGIGPVTAGKILAAKRPELIPIWDQWTQAGLGSPIGGFWIAMWTTFQTDTFVNQLDKVRQLSIAQSSTADEAAPRNLSLLRTLDIIVWMRGYGCRFSLDPKVKRLEDKPLGER